MHSNVRPWGAVVRDLAPARRVDAAEGGRAWGIAASHKYVSRTALSHDPALHQRGDIACRKPMLAQDIGGMLPKHGGDYAR